ncbi:hypothetical protein [Lysobacter niastensis]|uniref:HPt domain-containing protein n=1 Tax=Lysobacter niastensis TaxID=380629 RepID=A0ABS0B2U4_9GAMM|nr:hypothetical protein [Lysobacter niastensis]MBF6022792.1 hypothetical protein [Lysobacter niastensis]
MQASSTQNAFPALVELLRGDANRLGRVLRAIHQSIAAELNQLDQAVTSGDGQLARAAAHRAAMACHLLGEAAAGERLAAIGATRPNSAMDPVLVQRIVQARTELAGVINRTSSLLDDSDRSTP